jgi:3-hydroxyacyl-[acyl-carrier-protein] dehydratase
VDAFLTEALTRLPHGPQFRFIDRLLDLEPGRSGQGEYVIRGDESFLAGHFPGQPIFPGVLLVEAAAQLAGIIAQSDPVAGPMAGLKLTALRAVKILGAPCPGDVLTVQAKITGRLANLVQADASISVNGHLVMQGALTLSGDPTGAERSFKSK